MQNVQANDMMQNQRNMLAQQRQQMLQHQMQQKQTGKQQGNPATTHSLQQQQVNH